MKMPVSQRNWFWGIDPMWAHNKWHWLSVPIYLKYSVSCYTIVWISDNIQYEVRWPFGLPINSQFTGFRKIKDNFDLSLCLPVYKSRVNREKTWTQLNHWIAVKIVPDLEIAWHSGHSSGHCQMLILKEIF